MKVRKAALGFWVIAAILIVFVLIGLHRFAPIASHEPSPNTPEALQQQTTARRPSPDAQPRAQKVEIKKATSKIESEAHLAWGAGPEHSWTAIPSTWSGSMAHSFASGIRRALRMRSVLKFPAGPRGTGAATSPPESWTPLPVASTSIPLPATNNSFSNDLPACFRL